MSFFSLLSMLMN